MTWFWRPVAVATLAFGAGVTPVSAQRPPQQALTTAEAAVYLEPDASRTPLAVLKAGTWVRLLRRHDAEWHRISFADDRWGERVGYVRADLVRIPPPPPPPPELQASPAQPTPPASPRARSSPVPGRRAAPDPPARAERNRPRWWESLLAGLVAFAEGYAAASGGSPLSGPPKLMLFGGRGHDTYLGCLSCSEFDGDSIFNEFGRFGSQFSSTSIFNSFSQFGSRFSTYSPCNPYASDPPVIVDPQGRFYGRLTVNRYHRQRVSDSNIQAFVAGVCAGR